MEKLTPQQIDHIHKYLLQSGLSDELLTELLDHLVCEIEHYLWIGLPFESALEKTLMDANADSVQKLRKLYQRELAFSDAQLAEASLDDILFQFRNKSYGAYSLRQSYQKTLVYALFGALGLGLMMVALLHLISQRTWSYWSPWGMVWIVGVGAVTIAVVMYFLQQERWEPVPNRKASERYGL
ncbi:hypothetical protein EXU85_01830 [Spirosoma sp. KCTC 42546]|uniref:hypothetical protein n=1 Tax=Spirosoma sp. KCTC 42546 TaxID=2520506 RepID=UPI00115AD1F5|nr:hypothetical protein [Spirosoma sp. KCTC 42546]QDK77400.1 hypothetical protein EXU85_01830 [Spirosoma sp. KCTC 42546]